MRAPQKEQQPITNVLIFTIFDEGQMRSRGDSERVMQQVVVSQPDWLQIDKITIVLFPMLLLRTKLASFVWYASAI